MIMKRLFGFIISMFLICISSCGNHITLPIDDEHSQETALFREQCLGHVYGKWGYVDSTTLLRIEQHYCFKPDSIFDGHTQIMARDSVLINGKHVLTDWQPAIDKDVHGEWKLLYDSKAQKRIILMNYANSITLQSSLDFIKVNDSILETSSPLLVNKTVMMHREQ